MQEVFQQVPSMENGGFVMNSATPDPIGAENPSSNSQDDLPAPSAVDLGAGAGADLLLASQGAGATPLTPRRGQLPPLCSCRQTRRSRRVPTRHLTCGRVQLRPRDPLRRHMDPVRLGHLLRLPQLIRLLHLLRQKFCVLEHDHKVGSSSLRSILMAP